MGCCLSGFLGCLIAGAPCRCCCICLPSCPASISTRITYMVFLIVGVVASCICLIPGVADAYSKVVTICNSTSILTQNIDCTTVNDNTRILYGFAAVYRISFGFALFYAFFMLLMINVKSSKDCRSSIQNGIWLVKAIFLIGLIIGAFFIKGKEFEMGLSIVGGMASFLFYIVQVVLLIDFSYRATVFFMDKYENTSRNVWLVLIVLLTLLSYIGFLVIVVVLYIFYANAAECSLQKFFISFNLILCVLLSVVSILPKIKKYNGNSGLFQSSIVSLYTMYLTWTAMASSDTCNPQSSCITHHQNVINGAASSTLPPECANQAFSYDVFIPIIILLLLVIYTGFSNSSHLSPVTLGQENENTQMGDKGDSENKFGQKVYDDEEEAVTYSYSFLHFIYLLVTLFLMMTLTHWYPPQSQYFTTTPAVWVKISSSWLSLLLYAWTLFAPWILKDRQFN